MPIIHQLDGFLLIQMHSLIGQLAEASETSFLTCSEVGEKTWFVGMPVIVNSTPFR